MEPIVWNFTGAAGEDSAIHRGASRRKTFTFALPGATSANGFQPRRDLTGCTAHMDIRVAQNSAGELLLSLSDVESEDGQIIIDGPNGTITFFITRAGSLKLTSQNAFYDMFIDWPNGVDVDKVVMGKMKIDPNVTATP